MRHARHDPAIEAALNALRRATADNRQRFIVVVYDGPEAVTREASYDSNVDVADMRLVLQAVVDQSRRHGH